MNPSCDEQAVDDLLREIEAEFPKFRVVPKATSSLSKVIDVALRVITLGAQSRFMTHYHTVLFDTLYVPSTWNACTSVAKIITLRHERVHLRQRRRYGDLLMSFLYLVPFFALGLAYGGARIEWEAYSETIRARAELCGVECLRDPALRRYIVEQFTSGAYGWMWPFPRKVGKWFDLVVEEVEALRRPC